MQFTVNGQDTYKSNLGAWVTIIIYSIVLVYSANKSIKLSGRLDTIHYENWELKPTEDLSPTTLEETMFNIAFRLNPNDDRLGGFEISYEGFVELEVKMITFDFSKFPQTYDEKPINIHKCSVEKDEFFPRTKS